MAIEGDKMKINGKHSMREREREVEKASGEYDTS